MAERLDDLTLGRVLGRGVSGRVLLAVHRETKAAFALKTIEKARIKGQSQLTQLYREKEFLSTLRHAAIVRFYTTFKDEDHLYFLLDKLEGGELLWHMRRSPAGKLPEETARRCLGAALQPLRYMQEKGVLYRDLKPTNLIFSRAGRLTLVDLAHAKRIGAGSAEWLAERSDSVCGTPHYHAPETVRGEGHGPAAQLWALGVLLYEMLMGVPPFWEPKASGGSEEPPPPLREQILAAAPPLDRLEPGPRATATALLQAEPEARAASFPDGYSSVMALPWLESLPWDAIDSGECVPALAFAEHAREWDELDAPAPEGDPFDGF